MIKPSRDENFLRILKKQMFFQTLLNRKFFFAAGSDELKA